MYLLSSGLCIMQGHPDVCTTRVLTPEGAEEHVQVPYVNETAGAAVGARNCVHKVIVKGLPALNQLSRPAISNNDEAGELNGVVSATVMDQTSFVNGSSKVIIGGAPAVKVASPTGQNGSSMNCSGAALTPSQTKVLILS